MAGFNVVFHGGAAEEAGGTGGLHFLGRATAGGAEIDTGVTAGAEEGGEEGQDYDIHVFVLAHLGKGHLARGRRLAIVDCNTIGRLGSGRA